MYAYPCMSKKLVCKYTATMRRAMPIKMSAAIVIGQHPDSYTNILVIKSMIPP